jgi:streptomycin 6-kinase
VSERTNVRNSEPRGARFLFWAHGTGAKRVIDAPLAVYNEF